MKETSAVKIYRIKFILLKEINDILEENYNGRQKFQDKRHNNYKLSKSHEK